jgi:hypothetical protein
MYAGVSHLITDGRRLCLGHGLRSVSQNFFQIRLGLGVCRFEVFNVTCLDQVTIHAESRTECN